MIKHFCDGCAEEIVGPKAPAYNAEVYVADASYDNDYNAVVSKTELCRTCGSKLKTFLREELNISGKNGR